MSGDNKLKAVSQMMDEVAQGHVTSSEQLLQIAKFCFSLVVQAPDEFGAAYERFLSARDAVGHEPTIQDWEELKLSAQGLGAAFRNSSRTLL